MVLTLLPAQAAHAEETDTAVVETVEAQQTAQDTADASQEETTPAAETSQEETTPAEETSQEETADETQALGGSFMAVDTHTISASENYPVVLFVGGEGTLTASYTADDGVYSWSAGSTAGVIASWSAKNKKTATITGGTPGYTTASVTYLYGSTKYTEEFTVNVIGLSAENSGLVMEETPGNYTGTLDMVYDGGVSKADNYFEQDTITVEGAMTGATITIKATATNGYIGAAQSDTKTVPTADVNQNTASADIQAKYKTAGTIAGGESYVTVTYSISNATGSSQKTITLTETVVNHFTDFQGVDEKGYALTGTPNLPNLSISKGSTAGFMIAAKDNYEDTSEISLVAEVDQYNKKRIGLSYSEATLASNDFTVTGENTTLDSASGTGAGNALITISGYKEIDGDVVKVGTTNVTVGVTETTVTMGASLFDANYYPGSNDSAGNVNKTVSVQPIATNSITYTKSGSGTLTWVSSDDNIAKVKTDDGSSLTVGFYGGGIATISAYSSDSTSDDPVASFVVRVHELYAANQTLGYSSGNTAVININAEHKAELPSATSYAYEYEKAAGKYYYYDGSNIYFDDNDTKVYYAASLDELVDDYFKVSGTSVTRVDKSSMSTTPVTINSQALNLYNITDYINTNYGYYTRGTSSTAALNGTPEAETLTMRPLSGTGISNWTVTYSSKSDNTTGTKGIYTRYDSGTKALTLVNEVLTIDSSTGVITALQPGTATVEASYSYNYTVGGKTTTKTDKITCNVTVQESPLAAEFTPTSSNGSELEATLGSTVTFTGSTTLGSVDATGNSTFVWTNLGSTGVYKKSGSSYVPYDLSSSGNNAISVSGSGTTLTVGINGSYATVGDIFKIVVPVTYSKGSGSNLVTFSGTATAYVKIVEDAYTVFYQDSTGATSVTNAPELRNVFLTMNNGKSYTNSIQVALHPASGSDTTNGIQNTYEARSADEAIATASLGILSTSYTGLTITPVAPGHTTVDIYPMGSDTALSGGTVDVWVFGVSENGEPITTMNTAGTLFTTSLGILGSQKESIVLGLNTGSDELDAVSQTIAWNQTSGFCLTFDSEDSSIVTANSAGTAIVKATITIKMAGKGTTHTYTLTDANLAEVTVTSETVKFDSITFTNQTDGDRDTSIGANTLYPTDTAYVTAKVTDAGSNIDKVVFTAYTSTAFTDKVKASDVFIITTSEKTINKRTNYIGTIKASKLGTYYIKAEALNADGDVIQTYYYNTSSAASATGLTVSNPAVMDSTTIYAFTDFAPVYSYVKGVRTLTGYLNSPALSNVVATAEADDAYYTMAEGWSLKDGTRKVSVYSSEASGKAIITANYSNYDGKTVYDASGDALTADITVYLGSVGGMALYNNNEKAESVKIRVAGPESFSVVRDLYALDYTSASYLKLRQLYEGWVDEGYDDGDGELVSVTAKNANIFATSGLTVVTTYDGSVNDTVNITAASKEGSTTLTYTEFGNSYDVAVTVASVIYEFKNLSFDTTITRGITAGDYAGDYYVDVDNTALAAAEKKIKVTATVDVGAEPTVTPALSVSTAYGSGVASLTGFTLTGITTAGIATFEATATVSGTGDASFVVTGNDKLGTQETLTLHVIENSPVTEDPVINSNLTTKTATIPVGWTASALGGYQLNTVSAPSITSGNTDGYFSVAYVDGALVLTAANDTPADDYPLTIAATAQILNGMTSGAESPNLSVTLGVTVSVVARDITGDEYSVTQLNTYNVFYKNDFALVKIEDNNAPISTVGITSGYYDISAYDTSAGLYKITLKNGNWDYNGLKDAVKSANKKVVINVTPNGYTTPQAELKLTLAAVNKPAKFTLSNKNITIFDMKDSDGNAMFNLGGSTVLSGSAGTNYDGEPLEEINGLSLSYSLAGVSVSASPEADGTVTASIESGTTTKSGKLQITGGSNWQTDNNYTIAVPFKVTVKTKSPKLQLSAKTISLNTSSTIDTGYEGAASLVTLTGGTEIPSGFTATIESASKKLSLTEEGGVYTGNGLAIEVDSDNYVNVTIPNGAATTGSYKVNVVYSNGSVDLKTPLTIKVVNKEIGKSIKVSQKGKIDLVTNGSYMTVVPKLSNVTGEVVDVKDVTGTEFTAVYNDASGEIRIRKNWNYEGTYQTNKKYSVSFKMVLENAVSKNQTESSLITISFKPTQSKLKATAVPKVATLTYNTATSGSGYATIVLTKGKTAGSIAVTDDGTPMVYQVKDVTGFTLLGGELSNDNADDGSAGYTFRYRISGVKNGKTVSVKFNVYQADQAGNVKPATVTVKIKVKN